MPIYTTLLLGGYILNRILLLGMQAKIGEAVALLKAMRETPLAPAYP